MPVIVIKEYSWRQTPEDVIISVTLVGKPKKIDVFAIGNYLKASYPPFMLELFLHGEILEESSSCTIGDQLAIFTLKKSEIGQEWPTLTLGDLTREKKQKYRVQALERSHLSAERRAKERGDKCQRLQQLAVREHIECDTREYNKIQAIRDEHRREAMREFEEWRQRDEIPIFENETGVIQRNQKMYKNHVKWFKNSPTETREDPPVEEKKLKDVNKETEVEIVNQTKPLSTKTEEAPEIQNAEDIRRGKKIIDDIVRGKYRQCGKIFEDSNTSIPVPRECGTISVQFSERAFPTPARESHHLEEQEWLQKQAEARRKCGFATENLREEEQNPMWLKDKGDEFFQLKNYLAAINAYTHGIKLSPKMSSLYANRAAAQYALGNYRRCGEDCSEALQLMVPKCEGNRDSRARCHARLGAALCKLSSPQHGIPELEEALKLDPENDTIKRDLEEAKHYFNLNNYDE